MICPLEKTDSRIQTLRRRRRSETMRRRHYRRRSLILRKRLLGTSSPEIETLKILEETMTKYLLRSLERLIPSILKETGQQQRTCSASA
jgi:hypothetical protein